ncbi:hypothetical protein [Aeromicrobium choanae]|uniref:Spheroidene monooxygenase n=1 Tax=Aeromicrobium choanae TaxID=1736691 RepID=A0A1T4YQ00_9ACTN|nr:hypothetical protein [Aeromicrobium choanae]SKB03924.1 hypothetical protein SAMN06295964_0382 [Aeromicrobium choanae]
MTIHSFHLAEVSRRTGARALLRPPTPATAPGLDHLECLSLMRLGAPVVSPDRLQLRRLAVFAQWQEEAALDRFLVRDPLGPSLAAGWHVRMEYLRRWSSLAAFPGLPVRSGTWDQDKQVVAVTLARMRTPEIPRFLRHGRPVERLVRDHPGVSLAVAAFRPPRTISTFTVWHSTRQMLEMVHGRSSVPDPTRHADAMRERERRDFHHEFATFRFRPLSEHGSWDGATGLVPDSHAL